MKKVILVYDEINSYSAQEFINELMEYDAVGNEIEVRFNTVGGNVIDGIAMYNCIKRAKANVTAYVDGMAGSIGSIIMCACPRILISKYGTIMIHKPAAGLYGNVEELQQSADLLTKFETMMVSIYAERCGKTPEDVRALWMDGKDHWITATDALADNLVDALYDNDIESPVGLSDGAQYFAFYQSALDKKTKTSTSDMKQLILMANAYLAALKMELLPETATEADVASKFKAIADQNAEKDRTIAELNGKIKEHQDKETANRDNEIKALCDQAIKDKKFTEGERAMYTALLTKDFDNTKAIIAKLNGVPSAQQVIEGPENDARKDWTFNDYRKKDPTALAKLRTENPDAYNALKDAQFKQNK